MVNAYGFRSESTLLVVFYSFVNVTQVGHAVSCYMFHNSIHMRLFFMLICRQLVVWMILQHSYNSVNFEAPYCSNTMSVFSCFHSVFNKYLKKKNIKLKYFPMCGILIYN